MRLIILLCVIFLLAGCQRNQRTETDAMEGARAAMLEDSRRSQEYCKNLMSVAELDPIRKKISLFSSSGTTFEMLTDNTKPNSKEKSALVHWANLIETCHKEKISLYERNPRLIAREYKTFEEINFPRFQFLVADLHNGMLTYSEFSRKRKELASDNLAKREELRLALMQRGQDAYYRTQQILNEQRKAAAMEEQASNQHYANTLRKMEIDRSGQPVTCKSYFNMVTCQ